MQNFLFVDLSGLTAGKPFAGFAAGSFVDMNGREVEFKASTLKTFIANTLKAITAAQGKGMPGLPIDARAHDKGEAAGWIVDASAGEVEDSDGKAVPVIMLAAEWTKLGLELLRDKIMANFSPTVDLKNKAIRGGSLTNWPASVDASGAPLFAAIELAEGMYRLQQEESLEDRIGAIRNAWYERFGRGYDGMESYVIETFEDYLIVGVGGKTFRVEYAGDEDGVEFAPRDQWIAVEQTWVEAQIGRKLTDAEMGRKPGRPAVESEPSGQGEDAADEVEEDEQGELTMEITREELGALVAEEVRAALSVGQPQAAAPDGQPLNVLGFLEMADVGEEIKDAFKKQLMEQHELMRKQAALETAEMINKIRRDSVIAEFAQAVTGGTPEVPYGLPVSTGDLKEFLSRLQPTDMEFAMKLLSDIQAHGRQKFAELGHGKQQRAVQKLPAEYAAMLKAHVKQGGDVEEWFEYAGIGDAAEFDLSQFAEKEN